MFTSQRIRLLSSRIHHLHARTMAYRTVEEVDVNPFKPFFEESLERVNHLRQVAWNDVVGKPQEDHKASQDTTISDQQTTKSDWRYGLAISMPLRGQPQGLPLRIRRGMENVVVRCGTHSRAALIVFLTGRARHTHQNILVRIRDCMSFVSSYGIYGDDPLTSASPSRPFRMTASINPTFPA